MPRTHVPNHPLIADALAQCRDRHTATPQFRAAVASLGHWLAYEICRDWLPTIATQIETPLDVLADATIVNREMPIEIVPILRAGLALVEGVLPLLPEAKIRHIGYRRDEATARAACYLDGLPAQIAPDTRILILEPMLATGGTLLQALDALTERGADIHSIRVLSIIASRPALERIGAKYPDATIFCAAVDAQIDERFFIVPGLGDAGDRAFGTE